MRSEQKLVAAHCARVHYIAGDLIVKVVPQTGYR